MRIGTSWWLTLRGKIPISLVLRLGIASGNSLYDDGNDSPQTAPCARVEEYVFKGPVDRKAAFSNMNRPSPASLKIICTRPGSCQRCQRSEC
ncbi:hypothetical protein BDV11DRAFT_176980 [Aspergillus similis]